jgi:hypothetical protein
MRNEDRRRIDYAPGNAALHAFEDAQRSQPDLSQQALLDKLVILGEWALRLDVRPPPLYGKNRHRWRRTSSGEKA